MIKHFFHYMVLESTEKSRLHDMDPVDLNDVLQCFCKVSRTHKVRPWRGGLRRTAVGTINRICVLTVLLQPSDCYKTMYDGWFPLLELWAMERTIDWPDAIIFRDNKQIVNNYLSWTTPYPLSLLFAVTRRHRFPLRNLLHSILLPIDPQH